MAASMYKISKGLNRSIEFKGLKAQYIWWLLGGLIADLVFFAVLCIVGINAYLRLGIVFIAAVCWATVALRISHTYGEFGLMKMIARRSVPRQLRSRSRKGFIHFKR